MADVAEVLAPSAGVETVTAAPPTAAEVEQVPAAGQPETEIQTTAEEVDNQPEQEVDLDSQPDTSGDFEQYKPLFAANPELRTILGREKAFSDIAPNGSFRELKEIVERVPTLDDAETLATQAANHRQLGETFRSDAAGFADALRESDPMAFNQFAEKLPEILAQTDTRLYSEQARIYSNAVLDNLFSIAQRSNNTEALTSIQNVAQMLGVQLGQPRMAPNQGNSEVERLRRELNERKQQDASSQAETFWNGANEEYTAATTTDIEAVIRKSYPEVTDAQLKRMSSEVWEGVNQRLGAQPQTVAQIENFKKNVGRGRMSVADHKAIVDFSARRAKQLIPHVWKEVSAEWSKQIVAFNKKQIEKKNGIAATTTEVTPNSAPGTSAVRTPRVNPIQSPKRNFNSVFESLRTGNYQAPAARR